MELIGLIVRAFVGLGDALVFFDFLYHILLGALWWVSPKFRRETKEKEDYKKIGIYFGAFILPVLIILLIYFITT